MANIKVSELNEATTINDEDLLMVVQGNENKKVSIETLMQEITNLKTITFNNDWILGHKVHGAGLMVLIPIFNPTGTAPTINLTNAQVFDENEWKNITYASSSAKKSYIYLIFNDIDIAVGDSCLVRIAGTISAN